MAAFQNHLHSAVDNAYYDDRFTSNCLHHHYPVIMGDQNVAILGYAHAGYMLMYSQYWIPLYLQYQPQPYVGSSYNHNVINNPASFSGGAASNDYHQFIMSCDESLILNAREEEDNEIVLNEEEIRALNLLDEDLVVYDSTDVDDDGLSEETITEHLKTRDHDHHPAVNAQICVVCQDCLFQEGEKIAALDCRHDFHAGCIKQWLMLKNCCPLCKATAIRLLRNQQNQC